MRLLLDVALEEAGGRGSGLRAAGKARPLRGNVEPGEHLFDASVDKGPGTHILRLFLAPDDLGVAVMLQHLAERVERKRIELLDPHQRYALVARRRARLQEVEINLARAQY